MGSASQPLFFVGTGCQPLRPDENRLSAIIISLSNRQRWLLEVLLAQLDGGAVVDHPSQEACDKFLKEWEESFPGISPPEVEIK